MYIHTYTRHFPIPARVSAARFCLQGQLAHDELQGIFAGGLPRFHVDVEAPTARLPPGGPPGDPCGVNVG